MTKEIRFKSWGDAEADRLWREMYEAEMELDDMDLLTNSPKLQRATEIAHKLHKRFDAMERASFRQSSKDESASS